ncbi:MAG: TrmH family RNA methyltransferase, partial [Planctomycetota bacterium]
DEKAARRAGLDYWPRLELHEHGSLEAYRDRAVRSEFVLLSTRGERSLFDLEITSGTHLVFGGESRGLPDRLLREHPDRTAHLPMRRGERSLNVAAVACTVLYEALRQAIARGEIAPDAAGSF